MHWRTVLSATAAAGVVALGFAAPAQAQLSTFCNGTASDVTVPGNLVVRAGESCDLTNVTVDGHVTVRDGADFIAEDTTIAGNLLVRDNGYADTVGADIEGALRLEAAYGAYVEESAVGTNSYSTDAGFMYSVKTDHAANVVSTNGETYLESSVVGSNVRTEGDVITDAYDTWVAGNLRVTDAGQGAVLCTSEVDGSVNYIGNGGLVQVGADGPLGGCATTYVGGNLRLVENTADSFVSDNIVRGSLICQDNDPAPVGEDNRVRGNESGQCADMDPAAAASTMSSAEADAQQVESRKQEILDKIETRTTEGEEKAKVAGPADIGN
ncbi:MAG TPA: hypothetical protein VK053_20655 [Jiangellaceae bacterium]|nr:hypothetical protein [Jiangellaceae bacterium]